jgi:hypothetical protein
MNDTMIFFGFLIGLLALGFVTGWMICSIMFLRKFDKPNKEQAMSDAERIKDLENRIKDASILMVDWDGYYNPETKQGNAVELAKLIEDTFRILQNGKSWRDRPQDNYLQDLG